MNQMNTDQDKTGWRGSQGPPAPRSFCLSFHLCSSVFICGYLLLLAGCELTARHIAEHVILPEQRTVAVRSPDQLPPGPTADIPPPRTVSDPQPGAEEWRLSLDEAIRISLVNAKVIRVLAGLSAVSSGSTIYDPAIANTAIDQEQARFDPTLAWRYSRDRTENPLGLFDPFRPD